MIHEENGQIIVDDLRPMSELQPYNKKLLLTFNENIRLESTLIQDPINWTMPNVNTLPMPIYRPKDGA